MHIEVNPWSTANETRVEKLIFDGRMTPAGLAKIKAAKRPETHAKCIEATIRSAASNIRADQWRQ